jgi:hypothetical protein
VADHRGDPCEQTSELVSGPQAEQRGRKALADVQNGNGETGLETEYTPNVRSTEVSASDRADVDAAQKLRDDIPPRNASD